MRGPCPVCGGTLRAEVEVLVDRWISAYSCPRCGRFTAGDDVLALLERADDTERDAISGTLALRNERAPWGVPLRIVDLPPRLQS